MREVQRMYKQPFLTIGIANYNYSQHLIKAFKQIKAQNLLIMNYYIVMMAQRMNH